VNDLYRPQFLPDLLIAALERGGDLPCLVIGDRALTAHEMREEISRYVQAYRAQGIAGGDGIATLSKNRPEVLCSMGAEVCGRRGLDPADPARQA
jgi:fatty-acyl-CoA synthase